MIRMSPIEITLVRRISDGLLGLAVLGATALGGCATKPVVSTGDETLNERQIFRPSHNIAPKFEARDTPQKRQLLKIGSIRQTGQLAHKQLKEVSGMVASARHPGVLYAINDSGNSATLFAINETGGLLAQWDINARNRDWEDMALLQLAGTQYLVIGDTGDNLQAHDTAVLHLLREPEMSEAPRTLTPDISIRYRYEDGPRNVEAFSALGNTLYLLSKEPLPERGFSPHRLYRLTLPDALDSLDNTSILEANFVGTMPSRATGLEAKLAASLADVDLSYPTSMEFDGSGNTVYILTYREVLRIRRKPSQSWVEAFAGKAERMTSHRLTQAEALTVSPGRAIWFTSENINAPLWAIPIEPPL